MEDPRQRTLPTGQVVFELDGQTYESPSALHQAMLDRRVVDGPEGLRAAIEADELADAYEAAKEGQPVKMSVREYAKLKKIAPQLLYYYIRMKYIKEEPCVCGRKVIDVPSADAYLAGKAAKDRSSR